MPINNYEDLSTTHLDALREIGNIGTGNAATSLSSMLAKPVKIQVPKINILDYSEVADELGGLENMIVGMLLALSGEVTGMIMFLLQKDFAHMILNALLGESFTDFSEVDEMGLSALKEIGNILAASYVNAISQLTQMEINISVPDICIDMVGSILSVPAIYFANISDKIIFIQDEFNSDDERAVSHILMIPEVDSLAEIMKKLGMEI